MRSERGSSMVFSLLVLFAILTLGIAALSSASSGLTLATNYRTSAQAEQAAESGILYATKVMNNNGGVVDFTTDIVSAWSTLVGSSAQTSWSGSSNISYTVTPVTAASGYMTAASATSMWMTSTGQAPGQSSRTVNAKVGLLRPFTCGAIDTPTTSNITADFHGTNFLVDGDNYTMSGTADPSIAATLGISTRTTTNTDTILQQLNSNQQQQVRGASVPNQVASVSQCVGPSSAHITGTIVPNILSQPGVQTDPVDRTNINGNVTLGTPQSPQITYFSGDTTIKANGNAEGAGIMIVNGSLTIQGNFSFDGLVIVIGSTQIGQTNNGGGQTDITGNATLFGAIWTTDLSLTVGGSAGVRYSNDALNLANSIPGVTQPKLTPQWVNVSAWMQG